MPPGQQSAQSTQASQSGAGSSTDPLPNNHYDWIDELGTDYGWICRATERCNEKMRLLGIPMRLLGRVLPSEPRDDQPHLPPDLVRPEVESHRRLRNIMIGQILQVIRQILDRSDGWPPVFRGPPLCLLGPVGGGPSAELLVENLNEHVDYLVTGQTVDELLINKLTEYLTRITLWLCSVGPVSYTHLTLPTKRIV